MGQITDMREFVGAGEIGKLSTWKAILAELLGTLLLVLIVTAACISFSAPSSVVHISMAIGLTAASIIQAIGHVSGGHINPAVTCGLLVGRQVSVVRALLYVVAQCLGALAASGILKGVTPDANQNNLGMTTLGAGVNEGQAFGIEFLITFILVLTVFGVCDDNRTDVKGSAPLAIGLSIAGCHLAAIPFTGASMNPARSFGPAVISGVWESHWVYWAGPISGGMVAALLYTYVFRAPRSASYDMEMDSYGKRTAQP